MKINVASWLMFAAAGLCALNAAAESVTVGWPLFPLAQKLFAQYARETGKPAPELKLSNTSGSSSRMADPAGKNTLGYFTMAPLGRDRENGLVATPIAAKGYFLYANTDNPFLEQLEAVELPAATLAEIFGKGTTWEKLTGAKKGATPIAAIAPDREFLMLLGLEPGKTQARILNGDAAPREVGRNRFALGAVSLDTIVNQVITPVQALGSRIEPLRLQPLANGNWRLRRFGNSGGRGERIQCDQFGGILADNHLLVFPIVLQSQPGEAVPFAQALAKVADRLGQEGLFPYAAMPLHIQYPAKVAPDRKFVFAHAMQCFLIGGIPAGFAHSYPANVKSEDFAHWPLSNGPGVRSWWSERLAPFVSRQETASARLDLDCAEAAGLDAMGLLIYPGCLSENNPWNRGLRLMLEAAQSHRVKILFDLWGTFPSEWSDAAKEAYTIRHGEMLRRWLDAYPDAFLKINGKIALCFGRDMVGFGQRAATYGPFFKALGGRDRFYLICTQMDSRAHNLYNGYEALGDISTMWFVHAGWGDRILEHVLLPIRKRQDALCWGISPGYYRVGGCVTEGFGACKLADDWRGAITNRAGGAYIQSWNDMGEDHHMLESNFRSDSYIRVNRYFADWFRTGQAPEIREEAVMLFHRRHLKGAALADRSRLAANPSWTSAPLCDYIHVVTMLREPGDVTVRMGGETRTLKNVGAGFREWLLLVPVKKDHYGNQPYWNEGAYQVTLPVNTPYRTVTPLAALAACTPEAVVTRNGRTVARVVSRTGIADRFPFQTLSVVGSVGLADAAETASEPADFDAFWAEQKKRLASEKMTVQRREITSQNPKFRCFDVEISCPGSATPVRGILTMPKDAAAGSLPARLSFHGAGNRSSLRRYHAGQIVFDFNVHGILNDQPETYYRALFQGALRDYKTQGRESRDKSYFRGILLRALQAAAYLKTIPEWNRRDLIAYGYSMGGWQSIAVSALDHDVTLCVANDPALADLNGAKPGWPQPVDAAKPETGIAAGYFDTVHFARRLRCESYLTAGLADRVCPVEGIRRAFKAMTCPKTLTVGPGGHCRTRNEPGEKRILEIVSQTKSNQDQILSKLI